MYFLQNTKRLAKYLEAMKKIEIVSDKASEKSVIFRLDDRSIARLDAISKAAEVTRSSLVRQFVRWALETYEEQQQQDSKRGGK